MKTSKCAVLVIGAFLTVGARSVLADGEEVITAATGGQAISADTAKGAWTTLTGPVITETKARDTGGPGLGTIILNIPDGFEFNPSAPVSVLVDADGHKTINRMPDGSLIPVEVTPQTITLTITSTSRGGAAWPDRLTFQNVQVRPTAGSPPARGHITESGTCEFRNLTLTTGTWGYLRVVGGEFAGYVITGSDAGTAGEPVPISVQKVDQYGNPIRESSTETLVFSGPGTIGNYAPTINVSTEAFGAGIPVEFDSNGSATLTFVDYKAETTTLQVSDGNFSSTDVHDGLTITIAPGMASALAFTSPPVEVTYGSGFGLSLQTTDLYGNPSANGLGSSLEVSLGLNDSTGALLGVVTQDIGTSAGNGSATFENLQINAAGTYTIVASAGGLTTGTLTAEILKAALTAKADNKSKRHGAANPPLTGTLNGLKNNDQIAASYLTDARTDSPTGDYGIVPSLADPNNKLGNYTVSLINGILTVTPANASVAVISSENPSLQGSNVTFTATVTPVAPAVATPTGTVLFLTNGQPAGSVALKSGMASLTTDQLPLWNTILTAAYLGDRNFLPATNTLAQLVRPPLETPRMVSIVDNGNGTVTVTCHGTPAVEHYVQATATLEVPESWVIVSTNLADMWTGYWTYTEAKGQNGIRFYRAVKPY